jgi:hypothetical protein
MADVLELENAEEFEDDSISRMKASPFFCSSFWGHICSVALVVFGIYRVSRDSHAKDTAVI